MKVKLLTTHCPKCKVVEMKLKQKKIDYEECDDVGEMTKLGLRSAPGLLVNDQVLDFQTAVKWINEQKQGE